MAEQQQQNQNTQQNRNYLGQRPRQHSDSNIIFVGKKPAMNYVLACVTQLNGGHKEIVLRARGRAISHAVDIVQIVKNKFMTDTEISKVNLGTETVRDKSGQDLNVSTIEIALGRK